MADLKINFLGWARSGSYAAVPSGALTDGRLTGRVDVTLREQLSNETATEQISFDLLGPRDVHGLKPGAVGHEMPAPGTVDFETTKCAYLELPAADLPWRYTPQLAAGAQLRPWLVLVVARPAGGEVTFNSGGTVTLAGTALTGHDLARSARWAHVQEDAAHPGQRLARILSPRPLQAETDYVAVLVPAFDANGQPAWAATSLTVTLPVHHWWSFRTAEAGDFATLAGRLKPAAADATLGKAPLAYSPLPGRPELAVRGALARIGAVDDDVPQSVVDDLTVLTTPVPDPRRPVIGLPAYGDAWPSDPATTTWRAVFRRDPRPRAVGGLGARLGITEQDKLADAAAAQAGALDAAAQRIRALTAGLSAARTLWRRRLPADKVHRLALFGPALGRVMTPSGTVLDRAAAPDRPLPAAIFSAAARRVLRPGPNRVSRAAPNAAAPGAVLTAANRCPPQPPRSRRGQTHTDAAAEEAGVTSLDDLLLHGPAQPGDLAALLRQLVAAFDRRGYRDETLRLFDKVMNRWIRLANEGRTVPMLELLAILDSPTGRQPDDEALPPLLTALDREPEDDDLPAVGRGVVTEAPKRPCNPVNLGDLATGVGATIDPTAARPFIVDRVLSFISGLDDQPLTPPELCPDLDIPAWQLLRDHAPNWLLPGVQLLADDSVVAVQTNPVFVDAFLLGLNTQTIGELRFRNIPIRAGCTPLRQFWSRTDPAAGSYLDDIVGVHAWPPDSELGAATHQTPAAADADLVVVLHSPLFRRYPRTIVYLTAAPLVAGEPDWSGEPDFSARLLPTFQGVVTPDITFFGFNLEPALGARHWVVLEEPPHGFQFYNATVQSDGTPIPGFDAARTTRFHGATDGANFADAAFADPYRVMIRGSALIPEAA